MNKAITTSVELTEEGLFNILRSKTISKEFKDSIGNVLLESKGYSGKCVYIYVGCTTANIYICYSKGKSDGELMVCTIDYALMVLKNTSFTITMN